MSFWLAASKRWRITGDTRGSTSGRLRCGGRLSSRRISWPAPGRLSAGGTTTRIVGSSGTPSAGARQVGRLSSRMQPSVESEGMQDYEQAAIPHRIGSYPVEKRLGRGGMGEVFLA